MNFNYINLTDMGSDGSENADLLTSWNDDDLITYKEVSIRHTFTSTNSFSLSRNLYSIFIV